MTKHLAVSWFAFWCIANIIVFAITGSLINLFFGLMSGFLVANNFERQP